MKALVFGRGGQVSTELARALPAAGWQATFLGHEAADLADPAACAAAVAGTDACAVINAAAWTAVDAAEDHEAEAKGIPFVHIATDYVFDGSGDAPRAPGDAPGPLSAYGRTKLAGEEAVRAAGGAHVVLRTSWVVSAHGSNFVKTMLRLGAERDGLRIVADQIGGPTPAADIARALSVIAGRLAAGPNNEGHNNGGRGARPHPGGTYHFAGAPDVSWADFAEAIFARAGLDCAVERIPTTDYPTPAPRPLNSRLDCTALMRDFGVARPDWRAGLDAILEELGLKEPGPKEPGPKEIGPKETGHG